MKTTILITTLIGFLIFINSAYACISMPTAYLLNDTACKQEMYCSWQKVNETLSRCYSNSSEVEVNDEDIGKLANRTELIDRLEKYKNYSYDCETLNNETGDEIEYYWGRTDNSHWMYIKNFQLTDNDISVISDFLSNGYSVIRQTPEEYQNFLENANNVNNNLSTCGYYSAVANRDGWTGYSFSDESYKTQECANAPRAQCGGGGPVNALWNDLKPLSQSTTILAIFLNYWWVLIIIIVAVLIIGIIYKTKSSQK